MLIVFILCFTLIFVGCGKNEHTDVPKTPTTEEVLNEIYTNEERQQIIDHIFSVKHEGHLFDIQCYTQSPESHSKLYEISLKGLPLLIHSTAYVDEYREALNGYMTYVNFGFGIIAMLHANEYFYELNLVRSNTPINVETHNGKRLLNFFNAAEEDCSKIITSDKAFEEKLEALANYGILAIPFVKEEIDKGNLEYEAFFTEIGLHMTTEEFAAASCYHNNMDLYYNHRYSNRLS